MDGGATRSAKLGGLRWWGGHAVIGALFVATTWICVANQGFWGERAPMLAFVLITVIAAILGGAWATFAVTAASAVVLDYFFLPPEGFGVSHPVDRLHLSLFVVFGVLVGFAAARVRRALDEEHAERARLYDAGEAREMLLASERAARAEALRASRAKDEFVAILSHELRTPLNAVLGWAHLAKQPGQTPEQVDRALAVILRNGQQLAQVVGDMLDMSRILSGKLRVELERVAVAEVVDAAVDAHRSAAAARDVAIRTDLDRTASVRGDASRLQQIAHNLLSNAIKFSEPGGLVSVSLAAKEGRVELAVSDTGQGIPPTLAPHLFERFWQADASTSRRHGGLGLGLSIVKHLVEVHGGSVRAESEGLGKGARFVVELPLEPATIGDPPPSPAAPREAPLAGARVLVVDDEPDAQELLRRVLEEYGATVLTASSGPEALDVLALRPALDVLVSDIGMPGMDGYELIRRVRAGTAAKAVPAVALTAYARPEDCARALAAGYQAHLAKPVEPSEMLAKVAELAHAAAPA